MQRVWTFSKTMVVAAIMVLATTSFSHAQTLTVTLSAAAVAILEPDGTLVAAQRHPR